MVIRCVFEASLDLVGNVKWLDWYERYEESGGRALNAEMRKMKEGTRKRSICDANCTVRSLDCGRWSVHPRWESFVYIGHDDGIPCARLVV